MTTVARRYAEIAGQMYRALNVIATTPHIVAYLSEHDPKALWQVQTAVERAEGAGHAHD